MKKSINGLSRMVAEGRLSRRDFMQAAMAAGVSATLANSMVGKALAATPNKGGHLRVGLGHGSTTDNLDPATYENGYMAALNYSIHNHIGEVDSSGQIQPELAESWEASADAKTWVFNLRKGVEFHNGKTMDADDVIASINHHRGETKSPAKSLLEQVVSIRADGKHKVVVELTAGNADFPFVISDYHVAIKPSKNGAIDPTDGIGTGGYALKDFEQGVRFVGERNPNYFKENRAHFDSIELLSIIDVAARTNALTTGEIDVMDRCDLKTVHLLERNGNIKVTETTGTLHYTFPMRTDTAPFDNNHIRLALKYAMDREEIVKKVLLGHGSLGNDHPISPSNPYHASELPQRSYDPDKAKFHLKQAGLSNLRVELSAADSAFAGAVDAAVLYKEHAAAAGIEIDVIREPNDGYWSNVWMQKPFCACYWGGRPTEDWMFSTAYAAEADWNDTYWKHDRFNQLLIEARAELDSSKRREMYFEMQQIVSNDGGALIPMFANYVFATTDKVQFTEPMAGNWDLDGDKFMEKWSFA